MTRQRSQLGSSLWERHEQSAEGLAFLETLTGWLRLQPDAERAELERALHGRDDAFFGAELELFLGRFFRQQGWTFDRHPDLGNGKRPDYFVRADDPSAEFVVEARASVDADDVQRKQTMELLQQALDEIEGTEWIHLIVEGDLPGDFSIRRATRAIREFLDGTRAGRMRRAAVYTQAGCSLIAEVKADDLEQGAVATTWQFGEIAKSTDNVQPLLDAFKRKASRYGPMDHPYVIALFGQREFPLSRHSVISALYGTLQWNFDDSGDEPRFLDESTKHNGAFTSLKDGEPIHTRVSAAAIYVRRDPGTGMEYHLAVFHNPYAARPLSEDLFVDCPQFIPRGAEAGDVRMSWNAESPAWG